MVTFSFGVMIAAVMLSLLSLRSDRGDALGLPLVAIGSFTFLYIVQPLRMIQGDLMSSFLTDRQVAEAILVPGFMLFCFGTRGWRRQRGDPRPVSRPLWDARHLWNFGFATTAAGLCLYVIFLGRSGGLMHSFSQPHGQAMAWRENTAYLYNGPWWMLSGSAMMMLATSRLRVTGWKRIAFLSSFVLVLALSCFHGFAGAVVFRMRYGLCQLLDYSQQDGLACASVCTPRGSRFRCLAHGRVS